MKNKFKISILTILLLQCFIGFQRVEAVKAKPGSAQYSQPDGSLITLNMKGDEFIHWATTVDGYTILSAKSGYYEYAVRLADGRLGFSGITAHDPGTRKASELIFIHTIQPGLFFSKNQIQEMKRSLTENHSPAAPTLGGFPTTGVRAHLMIMANFSNTSTTYTPSQFNNLMNQANYNGTGSFRDYYLEVSYGLLTVNTDVTIWVTLPHTHDYYGPQAMWGVFAYDAVVAADQQAGVNFALYDNNGDGIVDGVCIAHQGRGQEESGNPADIWSHSWDLASAGYTAAQRTFDGVQVLDYTTIPEKGSPATMTTIGVMCHEFGHNLGTLDFYDTDYASNGQYDGTGGWDIMADGSWNGTPAGCLPAHHNAWSKNFYTWTNPTVLSTQQQVQLRSAQQYPDVVRFNTNTSNEYFLCENRQQTGFDIDIPGHGMIIYHVDGNYITAHTSSNDINATSHQGMFPMSATSTTANGVMLSSVSTINTSGCSWPGTSNKTTFTDATIPNAKSWVGSNTGLPLANIAENTTTKIITFCFISCPSTMDPSNFTATTVSTSEIDLGWTKNTNNDPVMLAFSMAGVFGTPVTGSAYVSGNTIPGGGTVLYNGPNTTFNHTGLTPNTTYYYKVWSVATPNTYSSGVTANATTFTTNTLSVTPSNRDVPASPSGSTQFTVSSNTTWTVFSDQSWCTVNPSGSGNGIITANYTADTTVNPRVANITTTVAGIAPVVVTVTQTGAVPFLTVAPLSKNVPAHPAASTSFIVTTNSSWSAVSDQSWCTITPSGTGTGTLIATYQINTTPPFRTANIVVTVAGVAPVTVSVIQDGIDAVPDPQNEPFSIIPNPVSGLFRIDIGNAVNIKKIDILDLTGKVIISRNCTTANDLQFDLSDEPQGCYLVKIGLNDSIVVRRLIITR
jgi:M6 family metalloprotease-like protein